jgi:hypothetical protein
VWEDKARVQAQHHEVNGRESPASVPEMGDSFIESQAAEEDEGVGEGVRHARVEIIRSTCVHDSEIDISLAGDIRRGEGGRREGGTHR